MGVAKFENNGRWINGQGGEGFLINLEEFEEMECNCEIINLYHDQLGRYAAQDVYGQTGYFYPLDLEVA